MLKKILLVFILIFSITIANSQSVSATYNSGNIQTGDTSWPGNPTSCSTFTLTLSVPVGAVVISTEVSYDFQARNSGLMSHQRSQIYCQETATDEGGYIAGTGASTGTQSYNRTGLTLANSVSTGSYTFEMRAYRTVTGSRTGCRGRDNRVRNNTWTVTVNYYIPSPEIGGYLGPGGVGKIDGSSALEIWLRADDLDADNDFTDNPSNGSNVDSWNDYSGNANNYSNTGVNRPTYNSGGTFEAVNFDASLADSQFLNAVSGGDYTDGSAFFATNPVDDGNSTGAFENTTHALRIEQWNNTNNVGFTRYGVADYSSSLTTPFGTNSIISWHKEGSSSDMTSYSNNSSDTYSIGSSTYGIPYDRIGRNTSGTDEASGDIFESILYSQKLNTAELIIVNNYLSAKYGSISIANDFYTQDNGGSGDFDFNVAGIGQASDGGKHEDSQGTGIIRINTPSGLGLDEFLFWGEETKDATYDFTTSSVDYQERLNSKWRVSKRNDLGTVSLSVLATDLDLTGFSCGDLRLIVSSSSDFSTKTSYTMSLSSGVYTATGVNFTDGDYFTLEYTDVIVVDGTQFYNGSGASNQPNTSDDCYKLLVKSTADGTPSLAIDADVREIEVETGGKLVVNTGLRIQVTNGIELNGDIRLVGNSQILQTHTGTSQVSGSGNLYMDQTGTLTNVYQSGYWSSPVTTNGSTYTISGVMKDGTTPTSATSTPLDINFTATNIYDGAKTSPITISGKWLAKLINASDWTREISPTAVTLNPGEGYNMKSTGSGTQNFTFKGIPNDGDYTSEISQNKLSLIGNPYPSALDADQFLSDNTSNIVGTLYFYESGNDTSHIRATYTGGYATRVSGVGTPYGAGKTPGQYIGVGQAFFVWRSAAGNADIEFNNGQRTFETIGGSNVFFSRAAPTSSKTSSTKKAKESTVRTSEYKNNSLPIVRIGFETSISETETYHRQVATAFRGLTNNYEDGFDAEMFDRKPSDIALKQDDSNSPMVITGIQNFDKDIELPLDVFLDKTRTVIFSLDGLENLNETVFLKDSISNTFYNLSEGATSLELAAGTYTDRFFITFKDDTFTEEPEPEIDAVTIFFDESTRQIVLTKNEEVTVSKVVLIKINGRKVQRWKDIEQNDEIRLKLRRKVRNGFYVVRVKTDKGNFNKKIIIK